MAKSGIFDVDGEQRHVALAAGDAVIGVRTAGDTENKALIRGNGEIELIGALTTTDMVSVFVTADTVARLVIDADGKHLWGAGSASAGDVTLYRSAADMLKTDDEFHAVLGVITDHVAGATPTGGTSGHISVGTGKLWANDAGTWKSVAIS